MCSSDLDRVVQMRRAVELRPDIAQLAIDLDDAYRNVGDSAARIAMLADATARMPRWSDLTHRLGLAYFDAGDYPQAVATYLSRWFHVAEHRYALHGHYVQAMTAQGLTNLLAGRLPEALDAFTRAGDYPENLNIGRPDRNPGSSLADAWRAMTLQRLGRHAEADQAWADAAQRRARWWSMGPWEPDRILEPIHAMLAMRMLGRNEAAAAMAQRIEDHGAEIEANPDAGRDGKGYVTLVRALAAGAAGDLALAADLVAAVPDHSRRYDGLVRLAKLELTLLETMAVHDAGATQTPEPVGEPDGQ